MSPAGRPRSRRRRPPRPMPLRPPRPRPLRLPVARPLRPPRPLRLPRRRRPLIRRESCRRRGARCRSSVYWERSSSRPASWSAAQHAVESELQGSIRIMMSPKATLVGMLFAVLSLGALPARPADLVSVLCESKAGERQHCPADTSAGVVLVRVTGPASCLLGKSWGYDDQGIWVLAGCGGEFKVAGQPPAPTTPAPAPAPAAPQTPAEHLETWGTWDPGQGFLVGKTRAGELSISGYALLRYINQNDSNGVFTDHLGTVRPVDTRQDIGSHRVIVWFKGWMGDPRLTYAITLWTVNATDQKAIFGNIGYQFSRKFSLYGGVNGNPGSRSLQGSHPYWLGHDRVMADEFFRPYFGVGVWANGELMPGLWYTAMLANSNSALGVTASDLDRKLQTLGASMWWMPTTHEFGPRGAYGDWEHHDKLATRFGFSSTHSPEQRFPDANGKPKNTTLRLADSLNVFDTGSLAPGVTVSEVHLNEVAVDAGM